MNSELKDKETKGSNDCEILLFSLGTGEIMGLDVSYVKEVSRGVKIIRTPNMPNGVDGIASLRGHVMPALNLGKFLGLSYDNQQVMMVSEVKQKNNLKKVCGFLVKNVDKIVNINKDIIMETENSMSFDNFISGVTKLPNGSLVSIVDISKIMNRAFGD